MMAVCADWLAERPEDQEREVQMQLIFPRKPMRKGTKFVLAVAGGVYAAYAVGGISGFFPFFFLFPHFPSAVFFLYCLFL